MVFACFRVLTAANLHTQRAWASFAVGDIVSTACSWHNRLRSVEISSSEEFVGL